MSIAMPCVAKSRRGEALERRFAVGIVGWAPSADLAEVCARSGAFWLEFDAQLTHLRRDEVIRTRRVDPSFLWTKLLCGGHARGAKMGKDPFGDPSSGLVCNFVDCGSGVGPTKVLREKVHCRSLSSIHILYNQALVGSLSMNATPLTRIVDLSLVGGSTHQFSICLFAVLPIAVRSRCMVEAASS